MSTAYPALRLGEESDDAPNYGRGDAILDLLYLFKNFDRYSARATKRNLAILLRRLGHDVRFDWRCGAEASAPVHIDFVVQGRTERCPCFDCTALRRERMR